MPLQVSTHPVMFVSNSCWKKFRFGVKQQSGCFCSRRRNNYNISCLSLLPFFLIKVTNSGYFSIIVNKNLTNHAMSSKFTILSLKCNRYNCVMCAVFSINWTGKANARPYSVALRASAKRN